MPSLPVSILTFDVFGTLLDLPSGAPWVAHYVNEVQAINREEKPYRTLDTIFDECRPDWTRIQKRPMLSAALARLKTRFRVAALSNANSSPALTARIAAFFDLPWDVTIDISMAHSYKPDPRVYLTALAQLSLDGSQVLHVAAHPYDLDAAKMLGFRTAYIHWPGYAEPVESGRFDYQVSSLDELASILGVGK